MARDGKARAVERFERAALGLGITPVVVRFEEETRTAEDAARAIGCRVGQIVKSLVFVGDAEPFLALTSGPNRADPSLLLAAVGANEVHRASPDEARQATGYAIGGTPPFGHPGSLRTFLDPDLATFDEIWAAAGSPDSVFAIHPDVLVRVTGAEIVDFKAR